MLCFFKITNWSHVFPILTDELVDGYTAGAPAKFKREAAGWFAEQRTINPRGVRHIVSVSLFWKNIRSAQPEIVIKDRAWFMLAGKRMTPQAFRQSRRA